MSLPCRFCGCSRFFPNSSGRMQHENSAHCLPSPDIEPDPIFTHTTYTHPKLNAWPCDAEGNFIQKDTPPPPRPHPDYNPENSWHPFDDRISFDWAKYQFCSLQSSKNQINTGLDLWLASVIKAGGSRDEVPWTSAKKLYDTVDGIQAGDCPFMTIPLYYSGPRPPKPPRWMTQKYELVLRDSRLLLQQQLATPDLKDQFNYIPYRQFNHKDDRVYSNVMSADWSWNEADEIAKDKRTWGAMLVGVIMGSDKTTVSVATGSQEYHPVYQSPINFTNTARRGHGVGVMPCAFLPIPKTSRKHAKTAVFQRFCRQLYHGCLARLFAPLRSGMEVLPGNDSIPEVALCPDGHYRRVIYSLGPYIADYPEQVFLSGIVQGWCAKCEAVFGSLDNPGSFLRTHERTDLILNEFDPAIVWKEYGIRSDVVPFTHGFPRADIHLLLTPDLLHQVIKGTFKDHLVEWTTAYITARYGALALEVLQDIDRRISGVPIYPGLRRFKDGRNFTQWTGDDSKALMKVYIAAIAGYVPSEILQCLSTFMDVCYIFRRNAITSSALQEAERLLQSYHKLRQVFIDEGTRKDISLPRQHSLVHYSNCIRLFGAPNGVCSSITESKHIKAVKEPWRRSNRFRALSQMVETINRGDKMTALASIFRANGMLDGTTSSFVERELHKDEDDDDDDEKIIRDAYPADGPPGAASIKLSATHERRYPRNLEALAEYISEPDFPMAFKQFLWQHRHPKRDDLEDVDLHVPFSGKIWIHHSAITRFYAPSDLCGAGGMYSQRIRCSLSLGGHRRQDTVFVAENHTPGMPGMRIARLRLLFAFHDHDTNTDLNCALVSWFDTDGFNEDTRMWRVSQDQDATLPWAYPVQVIALESIARGAHLLPVYGTGILPENYTYLQALDAFGSYYVNSFIDHHCHELLSQ